MYAFCDQNTRTSVSYDNCVRRLTSKVTTPCSCALSTTRILGINTVSRGRYVRRKCVCARECHSKPVYSHACLVCWHRGRRRGAAPTLRWTRAYSPRGPRRAPAASFSGTMARGICSQTRMWSCKRGAACNTHSRPARVRPVRASSPSTTLLGRKHRARWGCLALLRCTPRLSRGAQRRALRHFRRCSSPTMSGRVHAGRAVDVCFLSASTLRRSTLSGRP